MQNKFFKKFRGEDRWQTNGPIRLPTTGCIATLPPAGPLTPALSPSEGERETAPCAAETADDSPSLPPRGEGQGEGAGCRLGVAFDTPAPFPALFSHLTQRRKHG